MLVNAALLLLVYLVIGFGVVSLVRWTGRRFFAQLGASLSVLVRAVPLLLFFSLVMFFTTEIWQVFTTPGPGAFWTAMVIFVLLAMVFLAVRLPGVVREVQAESSVGDVPLRRKERLNLAAVALISEMLQVVFVSTAIWLFYVVLGALLVNEAVRQTWLLTPDDVYFTITWFGDDVQVNEALLRVATGVAAFAGLYYAVTILVDAAYRDQFVDSLTVELRDTFRRRSEYLELQRKRGVPVTPPTDPTGRDIRRNVTSFPSGNVRTYTSPRSNPARSYARIARSFHGKTSSANVDGCQRSRANAIAAPT